MTELGTAAAQVTAAASYLDVFGPFNGTEHEIAAHIKRRYRKLSRVLHPDRYQQAADIQVAEQAFNCLGALKAAAEKAVARGQYGQAAVLATVRTRKGVHEIVKPLAGGDLCTAYLTETIGQSGVTQAGFMKLARRPADRDLLQNEASVLKRLHGPDTDPEYQGFVPELLDAFAYAEARKPTRQATVTAYLEGFYNLEELKRSFASGLDPLHAVWIWRRLLAALGFAHENHVVHGAVLPVHVLVMPERHGVVLADWCYASTAQDDVYPAIKAVADTYRSWYPVEVLQKQAPSPATDLAMAARSMIYLMGGDPLTGNLPTAVPKQLRAFFRGCLQPKQAWRPDNAWLLLQEFDELLEEMGKPYYPRRFRPLVMPSGMAS